MNALHQYLPGSITAVALMLALAADAHAGLILSNASFDTPNSNYTSTTLTGVRHWGPSAAAHWTTWNNTWGTTLTTLLPSTLPGGGTNMIHVETTGGRNGIGQVMAPFNTGPSNVVTSAYVYVLSGKVSLGTGNGGSAAADVISTTTNRWERLQAPNGHAPANEVVVYSYGGPANYYVGNVSIQSDSVHISSIPEPSALLLSTLGVCFTCLGSGWWRRRGAIQEVSTSGSVEVATIDVG